MSGNYVVVDINLDDPDLLVSHGKNESDFWVSFRHKGGDSHVMNVKATYKRDDFYEWNNTRIFLSGGIDEIALHLATGVAIRLVGQAQSVSDFLRSTQKATK